MPSTRSHITLSFQLPPPRFHMGTGRLLFPYFTHRKRSFLFLNSSLIAMVIQQKASAVFLSRASWMKIASSLSGPGFEKSVSANLRLSPSSEKFNMCIKIYIFHTLPACVHKGQNLPPCSLFSRIRCLFLLPGGPRLAISASPVDPPLPLSHLSSNVTPFLPSSTSSTLAVVIPLLMCEYQLGKRGREGGRMRTEDNCVEA